MSVSSHLCTILVITQYMAKSVELPWGHGQHCFHSYSSFSPASLISSHLKTFIFFALKFIFNNLYSLCIFYFFVNFCIFRWLSSFHFKCYKPYLPTCNCPVSLAAPPGSLSLHSSSLMPTFFLTFHPRPLPSGLTEPSSLRFFTLSVCILITFLK